VRARLALFAAAALLLLPACGHTDRPEGVVERWLISLNQGKAGQPEKYAPDRLSQRVFPDWASKDPGDLDLIEVGRGALSFGPFNNIFDVPFRVKRVNGWSLTAVAILEKPRGGDWRIEALGAKRNFPGLNVPSQGGKRVGGASVALWLEALGVALLLLLGTMASMSTAGTVRPSRPETT
jgi:hypothetical protein